MSDRIWLRFIVGEAESPADLSANRHAHFDVTVETNAIGSHAESRRLAHIVKQRAPRQRHRGAALKLLQQHEGMNPDIALGMELRRLRHAFHPGDLGQHLDEKIGFIQQFEGAARLAFGQHLGEFIAHALAADRVNACRPARVWQRQFASRGQSRIAPQNVPRADRRS